MYKTIAKEKTAAWMRLSFKIREKFTAIYLLVFHVSAGLVKE